ncbi:hypothetical protein [Microtetraspora malaysiensis]|uniref:hypothetical protein n=1 Tax=Microtetraspora malaysiensis TaxID=161358 RepID=UPI003D930098
MNNVKGGGANQVEFAKNFEEIIELNIMKNRAAMLSLCLSGVQLGHLSVYGAAPAWVCPISWRHADQGPATIGVIAAGTARG